MRKSHEHRRSAVVRKPGGEAHWPPTLRKRRGPRAPSARALQPRSEQSARLPRPLGEAGRLRGRGLQGRTTSADSQGGGLAPRSERMAGLGRSGSVAGHASTPATGAGGGSASVVWACVLLRCLVCSRTPVVSAFVP